MRSFKRINRYNRKGLRIGYWEFYYNRSLECKGNYINGNKEGIWEFYHYTTGELHSKGEYIDGLREGVWEYYDENGLLYSWYKKLYERGKYIKLL